MTREELLTLARASRGPCVSLFLPTHRSGPDSRPYIPADVIRFKNFVRDAERRLEAAMPSRDARALLDPARARLDDEDFWRYQADGLAVFTSADLFRVYRVPLRVPELVVVSDRFHVKPLLALLTGDGVFHVLALSQNAARLLEGTRDGVSEVGVPGMPRSLADALRYDDPERQLQLHTRTAPRPGRRDAVFHGHGVGTDDAKVNVLRYCQQVARSVDRFRHGAPVPLVLAGVEYVQALFREASPPAGLLAGGIPGNPDDLRAEELHARAWPLVAARFREARDAARERYEALRGTGKTAVQPEEVLTAARHGRIDVLFVAVGVQCWGRLDRETGALAVSEEGQAGAEDLLNAAAEQTFVTGGTVYAVGPAEMPEGAAVAAIMRY